MNGSSLNLMTLPLGVAFLVPSFSLLPYHKIPRRWGNVARNALSWHEMQKTRKRTNFHTRNSSVFVVFCFSQQRQPRLPHRGRGTALAVVGVAKVGLGNLFDCICEGTSSQVQSSHPFRPTSDTPPVSFADSPLGEGGLDFCRIFA